MIARNALCAALLAIGCSVSLFAHKSSSSSSSSSSCPAACESCGKLDKEHCKVKKGCIKVPARVQTYFAPSPDCAEESETVPEAKIYYRMQGEFHHDKPTIVFIHGFGEAGDIWSCAQTELCSCYCTLSMDLRGFGRSSKTPASPQPGGIHYTQQLNVDDIYTVLGKLGITKNIVLVGHSLGANYAIRYASEHPDQVVRLVLTGAYPFIVPDCAVSSSCATSCFNPATCESDFCYAFGLTDTQVAGLTAPLTTCLENGGTEEACLNLWAQFIAPIWFNEPCQSQLQKAQASLVDAVTSSTVPIINSLFNFAVTEDIRSIAAGLTLPTLITFGSNDIVINPGNAELLHEQIANSVLAEFVGKGHQMHVTAYKSFDRLVAEFIGACSFPDTIKVFDQGCCVCPKTRPVDYHHDACCK